MNLDVDRLIKERKEYETRVETDRLKKERALEERRRYLETHFGFNEYQQQHIESCRKNFTQFLNEQIKKLDVSKLQQLKTKGVCVEFNKGCLVEIFNTRDVLEMCKMIRHLERFNGIILEYTIEVSIEEQGSYYARDRLQNIRLDITPHTLVL